MKQENNEALDLHALLWTIAHVHNGEPSTVFEALSGTVEDAVRSAINQGKPATVSLSLIINPNGYGNLTFEAKLSSKEPKPTAMKTALFYDARGKVFLADPRQLTFDNVHPINQPKEGQS